jgi:hypothetical protein
MTTEAKITAEIRLEVSDPLALSAAYLIDPEYTDGDMQPDLGFDAAAMRAVVSALSRTDWPEGVTPIIDLHGPGGTARVEPRNRV